MNPFHIVKNFKIRYKLLFIYSFTFFVIMGLSGLIIYSIVKNDVEKNIESELHNSTSAILNNVKTAVSVSIKNHLRAAAEKNYDIINYLYESYLSGHISLEEAQNRAFEIILCQKIGIDGYVCILDGNGRVVKHPKRTLEGLDISDHQFVKEMIATKNGYIEYEWQNPGDKKPRPKALYLIHFKPWNWMITVSSYREEFLKLVHIDDFKKSILSLKFGKTGYSYVMDTKGNVVIHPELTGINIFKYEAFSTPFFKKMLEKKKGKLVYSWKNPADNQFRKKLVLFNYIPEYDWIVASSSYMDEFYGPLTKIKNLIIFVVSGSILLFIPISFVLSSTITRPLRNLTHLFNQDIHSGFSNRQATLDSNDEVGQLAYYYNLFMNKLENYSENLKAEIAERKQAQEALQESEEKYRSVMEATPDPIVVYDMSGKVTYMNPAFTRVFGYTLEECMNKKMDHFVPKEHWKETMKGIKTILAGNVLPRTETLRKTKDGHLIDVTTRGSVYRKKNGEPIGSVIIHRDVSEVKRLEKAILEIGEKERQKIGNDLHDDLCPHLIGIEGLSKVLKKKIEPLSKDAGMLTEKVTELIKEATFKTRRLARGLCPVYFNYGLKSSLQELATNTRIMHGINCTFNYKTDLSSKSSVVVINLYHIAQEAVQNAVRHGNAEDIEIKVTHEDDQVFLRIQDNGCGMDDNTASNGMGLRIMKYRAGMIGASLTIKSRPEEGTRIIVRIKDSALSSPDNTQT